MLKGKQKLRAVQSGNNTSDILSERQLKAVRRIIWARTDMARYMHHLCSMETCAPMSEIELINTGHLQSPIVCADVFVCRYYMVHICHASNENQRYFTITLELVMPTAVGICYGCPIRTEDQHMVCAVSNKVIGFNISGVSFNDGGYAKSDLMAADKNRQNEGDNHSDPNPDRGLMRLEINHDFLAKTTRDVFKSLFHPSIIAQPLRKLRDYEISKVKSKICQEYKSCYNNYMTPNLFLITKTQHIKFRNVTLEIPERIPDNYEQVCEFAVYVVLHCFKIRCMAQNLQLRASTISNQSTSSSSSSSVLGTDQPAANAKPVHRRSGRKPINVKLEPEAFALAIIYKMRTGYIFEDRIVIPQSSFVARNFPVITVLHEVGLEKKGITKVSNAIVQYCTTLERNQLLDQLKFVSSSSNTSTQAESMQPTSNPPMRNGKVRPMALLLK